MAAPQPVSRVWSAFARDVADGLTKPGQKELPSQYLYDDVGSALFEAITVLPEYGLTRADERILQRHASSIVERVRGRLRIAELGSGTGRKTRWLLEAAGRRSGCAYSAIDISSSALIRCVRELSDIPRVSVAAIENSYVEGLLQAAAARGPGETLLVLFLGSTIGNFERPAAGLFLSRIRRCLRPGDVLLLGTDLVKSVDRMVLAYDDPAGVTAAFNCNLLARINRELGGDFDPRAFDHEARYNERERRIDMHLRSRKRQRVAIRDADCTVSFTGGETIWTESCHKFELAELPGMASGAGFQEEARWVDPEWSFSESLWRAE
jgi:L-histidine Nalpha-methyltransferase